MADPRCPVVAVFRFKLDELLLLPPPVTVAVEDAELPSLDECCIIGPSISDSSEESRCLLSPPLQGGKDKSIGLIRVTCCCCETGYTKFVAK